MTPVDAPATRHDFFVSYTQSDRAWAEWIAWVLEEQQYQVLVQAWDFVAASDWMADMDDGVRRAERTIAVLSPEYLRSGYGLAELRQALAADIDGRLRKLLPIRVAECQRPGFLSTRTGIDLFGLTEEQARERLLATAAAVVTGRAKPRRPVAFPGARAVPVRPSFPPAESGPGPTQPGRRDELTGQFGRAIGSFVGRDRALIDLAAWLNEPADPRPRVVTGNPGSGKTALLGLLANLASHEHRRMVADDRLPAGGIPAEGCIDVAIHAATMQTVEVLASLALAAGLDGEVVAGLGNGTVDVPTGTAALLAHLQPRDTPLVVLVDALDETAAPAQLARDVLAQLIEKGAGRVRLLLGTRRNVIADLGLSTIDDRVLDLDHRTYADRAALKAMVRAVLREAPAWSAAAADRLTAAARAIADVAGLSFYVGEAVARAQAALGELPDPYDPRWRHALPRDAGNAMREDLQARLGEQAPRAMDLLLPLAYARGGGLPWAGIWPALANALNPDHRYTNDDLKWLWEHAASYIQESGAAAGQPLHRLYHDSLADHLRRDGRDAVADERTITGALARLADGPDGATDWAGAPAYVRTHLAGHAVAAGAAGALVHDPGFLLHASPPELLAGLDTLTAAPLRAVAGAYRAALPAMLRAPADERAAHLSLAARCWGADLLADRIAAGAYQAGGPAVPWLASWASWRRQSPHRRLAGHHDRVRAVVTTTVDGRSLVVSTSDDRHIRVWDLASCEPIGPPMVGHTAAVSALVVVELGGRPVVVSASEDTTVRVWDLITRTPVGTPFTRHTDWVRALAVSVLGGRPSVVSGGDDTVVWVWDLETGQPLGEPFRQHRAAVVALAVVAHAEHPQVVSSSEDATVLVWGLADDEPVGRPFTRHRRTVRALATTAVDGRAVVVSGSDDKTVLAWDPATLEPIGAPMAGHEDWVRAVAIAHVGGRQVIVSGGDDIGVRAWDLAGGAPIGTPFTGHTDWVQAVAVASTDDRAVVVSGGADGIVRVWDLTTGGVAGERFAGHTRGIRALTTVDVDGRARLASAGSDGTVRLWDPASGAAIGGELAGHGGWVGAIASVTVDGRARLVSAGGDTTVRQWDPAAGAPVGPVVTAHHGWVGALAVARLDGVDVVVSAGADPVVRVWDPATGRPIAAYTGHTGWVRALAVLPTLHGHRAPVVLSAGDDPLLHVWDLATGEPLHATATGHVGAVRALAAATLAGVPVVVSAGDDGTIRVRGPASTTAPPGFGWAAGCGRVNALAVVPMDGIGSVVVCAGDDGTVRVRELASGAAVATSHAAHAGPARALTVTTLPAGVRPAVAQRPVVFSAGDDATIRVWDLATGARMADSGHDDWVRCVAVAPMGDGTSVVVSGSDDATIRVWDLATGAPRGRPLLGHHGGVRAMATATLDGAALAVSGGTDGTVRVWDLTTGRTRYPPLRGHTDWVRAVAVGTLDGRAVAVSASGDTTIRVWDLATGAPVGAARPGHTRWVRALAVAEPPGAGPLVVSGSTDTTVRVSRLGTGAPAAESFTGHVHGIRALALTDLGAGPVVVSGDDGGGVLVWDLLTGRPSHLIPHGDHGEIAAVVAARHLGRFRLPGRSWVAVAAGETVTVWSATPDGWDRLVAPTLGSDILAMAFADSARCLVVATKHGLTALHLVGVGQT